MKTAAIAAIVMLVFTVLPAEWAVENYLRYLDAKQHAISYCDNGICYGDPGALFETRIFFNRSMMSLIGGVALGAAGLILAARNKKHLLDDS